MTREITLSQGLSAIVDDADYEAVVAHGKWHTQRSSKGLLYARRTFRVEGSWKSMLMHSVVLDCPLVDHVNGDGLDNRRHNLRPATSAQNSYNRGVRSDNRSGFKGVSRSGKRWYAQLSKGPSYFYLGMHDSPEDAARAYDAAALIHFGEFARPNFPQEHTS